MGNQNGITVRDFLKIMGVAGAGVAIAPYATARRAGAALAADEVEEAPELTDMRALAGGVKSEYLDTLLSPNGALIYMLENGFTEAKSNDLIKRVFPGTSIPTAYKDRGVKERGYIIARTLSDPYNYSQLVGKNPGAFPHLLVLDTFIRSCGDAIAYDTAFNEGQFQRQALFDEKALIALIVDPLGLAELEDDQPPTPGEKNPEKPTEKDPERDGGPGTDSKNSKKVNYNSSQQTQAARIVDIPYMIGRVASYGNRPYFKSKAAIDVDPNLRAQKGLAMILAAGNGYSANSGPDLDAMMFRFVPGLNGEVPDGTALMAAKHYARKMSGSSIDQGIAAGWALRNDYFNLGLPITSVSSLKEIGKGKMPDTKQLETVIAVLFPGTQSAHDAVWTNVGGPVKAGYRAPTKY